MNRGALIGAAGLLAFAGWWAYRYQGEAVTAPAARDWGSVVDWAESAAEAVIGGELRLSRMRDVTAAHVAHPNMQAMFRVIRAGEGTADAKGYQRIVGGGEFESFADHPRIVRSGTFANGVTWRSSAAGAYQFIVSTWDETARIMGLSDFSPASQDRGAAGRIAARGALEDVIAGRFDVAVGKLGREWASLPGSPYGQPVMTMAKAREVWASAGGAAYA